MLAIFVSFKKERIITADGALMVVRSALVRTRSGTSRLSEVERFNGVFGVRLVVREWFRLRRLPRHEAIEKAVTFFLNHYHAQEDMKFDCYAFVNLAYGVESHSSCHLHTYWDTKPLDGELRMGDVIFLVSPSGDMFHHAAVYLGKGLFISVYGAGGDLEFSSLRDMKKFYKETKILVGTSRKRPA